MHARTSRILKVFTPIAAAAVFLVFGTEAAAHCDSIDGPVIVAAKAALAGSDVTPVLKWVASSEEGTIRAAFARTIAVRAKGPEAAELADTWFFETLVRIHRAGEGASFTGLRPAGSVVDPSVRAADAALAGGSVDALVSLVTRSAEAGIRKRFESVVEKKKHADHNVEAGRDFVGAYVDFVHYAERVYGDAVATPHAGEGHHH